MNWRYFEIAYCFVNCNKLRRDWHLNSGAFFNDFLVCTIFRDDLKKRKRWTQILLCSIAI